MSDSDNLTDRFLGGEGELSTRELVLQLTRQVSDLAAQVAQLGERTAGLEDALGVGDPDTKPLSRRINRLIADVAEFKTETRETLADVDRELARLSRQDAGRYLRLEERVQTLEHPEGPKS